MNVWFHTYFLSLCYIYSTRNVYKCRGCFDSIEHQFPSGRWSCLPWSLPRAGSGHVAWSRDLSPLETRDTWPDPWSDINSVIASQRKYFALWCRISIFASMNVFGLWFSENWYYTTRNIWYLKIICVRARKHYFKIYIRWNVFWKCADLLIRLNVV